MNKPEEPDEERKLMRRKYHYVEVRLRRIFGIPADEMIIGFEWDRSMNELVLTTLKD